MVYIVLRGCIYLGESFLKQHTQSFYTLRTLFAA